MKRASLFAFALLASLSLPHLARADVPPPDLAGCEMKKAGDACKKDDDSDGTCVQQKCSKLDYSNGSPPTTVEYDCILCSGPPAATSDTPADDADDGCSVALPGVTTSSMSAVAAIAAALLLMRRRPRKKS